MLFQLAFVLLSAFLVGTGQEEPAQATQDPAGFAGATDHLRVISGEDQKLGIFPFDDANRLRRMPSLFGSVMDEASELALDPIDDVLRTQLGLPKDRGLIIRAITAKGPAAQAGLLDNDILLTIAGRPLGQPEDLEKALRQVLVGGTKDQASVKLELIRRGKALTISVKPQVKVTLGPDEPEPAKFHIGVRVSLLPAELASHLELPANQGLIVNEIIPEGPASKARIVVNDIFLALNGKPLVDNTSLVAAIQDLGLKAGDLTILHGGKPATIKITPEVRKPEKVSQVNVRWTTPEKVFRMQTPIPLNPNGNRRWPLTTYFNSEKLAAPFPDTQGSDESQRIKSLLDEVRTTSRQDRLLLNEVKELVRQLRQQVEEQKKSIAEAPKQP